MNFKHETNALACRFTAGSRHTSMC